MNDRIRIVRESSNLTQQQFSDQIGVARSTIANIENGSRNINDHMVKSICREFRIRESWLRTGEGEMYDLPEDETAALVAELLDSPDDEFYKEVLAFIKAYQDLDPKDKETIKRFLKLKNENNKDRV